MECNKCLEPLPEQPARCPICGHMASVHSPALDLVARGSAPDLLSSPASPVGVSEASPFTGRQDELKQLVQTLLRPADDKPCLILIQGDPGIGKTRLARESLSSVAYSISSVIWNGASYGEMIPYGPLLHWIKTIASIHPQASPEEVDCRIEHALTEVSGLTAADSIYLQAAFGTPRGIAALAHLPETHIRPNLHRIISLLLASHAGPDGLCLVIDQAQWLDRATGQYLNELCEGQYGFPLVMMVLTRDALKSWMPKTQPDLILSLGPLSTDERSWLFDALVPAMEFLPELRRQVIEQSIGTPLFLNELSRLITQIMAENAGPVTEVQVANIVEVLPLSLEDLIRHRMAHLDQHSRQILQTAAVLGVECSLGLLECFDQIREELDDQLHVLEGLQLIQFDQTPENPHCRFREGYVRDLTYQALPERERRALHREAALAIERAQARQPGDHCERLAWHYERAGLTEPAFRFRIKAADRQARLGEIKGALESYEKALSGFDKLDADEINQTRATRILLQQGRLLRLLGQEDDALAAIEAASSLAIRLGNETLCLQAGLEQAQIDLWAGRNEEAGQRLELLKKEARRLRHGAAECVAINALGVIHFHAGRFDQALACFRGVVENAQRDGLHHLEADALNNSGLIYWRWSRYPEASRAFRAASTLRLQLADGFGLVAALLNLGIIQEQLGELQPARKNYLRALDLARQTGFLQGQAVLETNLSNLERRAGRPLQAAAHAAKAVQQARQAEDPSGEATALENLALAQIALGYAKEGVCSLEAALARARSVGAREKEAQIELDLYDQVSRTDGHDPATLACAHHLLDEIEAHGWRDLLPQACRLTGRLLCLAPEPDQNSGGSYLHRGLGYAVAAQNIFEEREALLELLAWGQRTGSPEENQKWRERAGRIDAMIRSESRIPAINEDGDREERVDD